MSRRIREIIAQEDAEDVAGAGRAMEEPGESIPLEDPEEDGERRLIARRRRPDWADED